MIIDIDILFLLLLSIAVIFIVSTAVVNPTPIPTAYKSVTTLPLTSWTIKMKMMTKTIRITPTMISKIITIIIVNVIVNAIIYPKTFLTTTNTSPLTNLWLQTGTLPFIDEII